MPEPSLAAANSNPNPSRNTHHSPLASPQLPEEHAYQGTEAWRPPEACYDACGSPCDEAPGGSPWGEEGADGEKLEEKLEVSDRSDLWALGLVVWEMLTGEVRQPTLTL